MWRVAPGGVTAIPCGTNSNVDRKQPACNANLNMSRLRRLRIRDAPCPTYWPADHLSTGWVAPAGMSQTPFGPKSYPAKLARSLICAVVKPLVGGKFPPLLGWPVVSVFQYTSGASVPEPNAMTP